MYLRNKKINGKNYKYAAERVRLPNGEVISLEKVYKKETKKELQKIFDKKIINENFKYSLKKFGKDNIFTEDALKKIEEIKFNYRKILKKLSKASLKDLLDRFTVNFTYESNALEGNSLTLKDVAIVIFENHSIKGKDLREIFETRNSRKIVEGIIKNKFDISHEGIIKIHRLLVKDIDINTGYKRFPNIIVGKRIKTTPPEKVQEEMEKLIKWYDENREKIHPLKLATLFHGRFEQIHPFEDGNGRVGRILINLTLIKNKYPPLIIRKSHRMSYIHALEAFDNKYSGKLERLILEKFKNTYKNFFEIYIKYI